MITIIAIIVLASALIQVLMWQRDLYRQKLSLESAWDDLVALLNKKAKTVSKMVDVGRALLSKEKNVYSELIRAKRELAQKETPQEKAKAEMDLDSAMEKMCKMTNACEILKKEKGFMNLQEKLRQTDLEIQAAKRFYNVNVIDFNEKFKSPFKNIVAKFANYKKRDCYDPKANEKTPADYRSEIEKYRDQEIERCKRRCELYDYKQNFGTDYVVLVPSIVLTLFIIGVALYSFYGFFSTVPMAKKLNSSIGAQVSSTNNTQNVITNSDSVDVSNWRTYRNNVFEIKYPPDWQMNVDETGRFSVKEVETNAYNYAGVDVEISIGKIDNPDNMPLADLLMNTQMVGSNFTMGRSMAGVMLEKEPDMVGGKDSMHTDHVMEGTKIGMHSNYWVGDKEVYYLDNILYNKDDQQGIMLGNKIVSTFIFLN